MSEQEGGIGVAAGSAHTFRLMRVQRDLIRNMTQLTPTLEKRHA